MSDTNGTMVVDNETATESKAERRARPAAAKAARLVVGGNYADIMAMAAVGDKPVTRFKRSVPKNGTFTVSIPVWCDANPADVITQAGIAGSSYKFVPESGTMGLGEEFTQANKKSGDKSAAFVETLLTKLDIGQRK